MKRLLGLGLGLVLFVSAVFGVAMAMRYHAIAKLNELLQASQGKLQAKRAMTLSEDSLKALTRVDVLLAVTDADLQRVGPSLVESLNKSKAIHDAKIAIKSAPISLGSQSISVAVEMEIPYGKLKVDATVHASAIVAATTHSLHWNLIFDGLEVHKVSGTSFLGSAAISQLVVHLNAMRPVINAALDEAVNDDPKGAVLFELGRRHLVDLQLADLSTKADDQREDRLKVDERHVDVAMKLGGSGVLINPNGILVAGLVEFVEAKDYDEPAPTFPPDAALILQPSDRVAPRILAYTMALQEKLATQFSGDQKDLSDNLHSGVIVANATLAKLVSTQLGNKPVTGSMTITKKESSTSDITFTIQHKDCHQYYDACDYKPFCEGNRCLQEVNEVVNKMCKYDCCLQTGLLGCIVKKLCERACNETVKVIRPINSAQCDGFRTADKLSGGAMCKVASNVDKAVCDIDATARKAICDTEQEVRRFYEKNPIATVTANMEPNVGIHASIAKLALSDDLKKLSAVVSASGDGDLKVGLKYDRHNYADPAMLVSPALSLGTLCATDWAESVNLHVSAALSDEPLAFSSSFAAGEEGALDWRFTQQGETILYVDFSPPPLVALFGGKPQVTLNCPLAAVASVVFASGESVFTQADARKVFPLLTGDNYPVKLRGQTFRVSIKPIEVCSPKGNGCEAPLFRLEAQQRPSGLAFIQAVHSKN